MTEQIKDDRRSFLSTTARLAAAAALLGAGANSAAAEGGDLRGAFFEAYKSGDLETFRRSALEMKGMTEIDAKILQSLTGEDVKYLGSLLERAGVLDKAGSVAAEHQGGLIF
jgi:hypothetical protein